MKIFATDPLDILHINNNQYYIYDKTKSLSPFTKIEYNFEKDFYNGVFKFKSPLTNQIITDTPEAYGRHRIVARIHEYLEIAKKKHFSVLDIGSGSAEIARMIAPKYQGSIYMVNSDVSGPYSDLGEKALLVRGMVMLGRGHKFKSITNVQYDFNSSDWPYRDEVFDIICSNMALHHISYDRKDLISKKIFNSLKSGGSLVLNDVYTFNLDRVMLTKEGKKGPEECSGYVEALGNTLIRLQEAGFRLSDLTIRVSVDESAYAQEDLEKSLLDLSEIMPLSKAIWYIVATKA